MVRNSTRGARRATCRTPALRVLGLSPLIWFSVNAVYGGGVTPLGAVTLGEALDNTGMVWNTSQETAWFGQTADTHDGVDAARSGPCDDTYGSVLQTSVTGPGLLTFWWRVDSEYEFDTLSFAVDGIQQGDAISGLTDWALVTSSIPAGEHLLSWIYQKDDSAAGGLDAGWVDDVMFGPPWASDTDHDGLPDEWERRYFGDLTTADQTTDFDEDGFPDAVEYRTATQPTNAASLLAVLDISPTPGAGGSNVVLHWPSATGRLYSIEYATNLLDRPDYGVLQTGIAGASETTGWTNAVPGADGPVYYRVRLDSGP